MVPHIDDCVLVSFRDGGHLDLIIESVPDSHGVVGCAARNPLVNEVICRTGLNRRLDDFAVGIGQPTIVAGSAERVDT